MQQNNLINMSLNSLNRFAEKFVIDWRTQCDVEKLPQETTEDKKKQVDEKVKGVFLKYWTNIDRLKKEIREILETPYNVEAFANIMFENYDPDPIADWNKKHELYHEREVVSLHDKEIINSKIRISVELVAYYSIYLFQEYFIDDYFYEKVYVPLENPLNLVDDSNKDSLKLVNTAIKLTNVSDEFTLKLVNDVFEIVNNSNKFRPSWKGALKEFCQSLEQPPFGIYNIYNFLKEIFGDSPDLNKAEFQWYSCLKHLGKLNLESVNLFSDKLTNLFEEKYFTFNFKALFSSNYFAGYVEDLEGYCEKITAQCAKNIKIFEKPSIEFCISSFEGKYYVFLITAPHLFYKNKKTCRFNFEDQMHSIPKCSVTPLIFINGILKSCNNEVKNNFKSVYGEKFLISNAKFSYPFIAYELQADSQKIQRITPEQKGESTKKENEKPQDEKTFNKPNGKPLPAPSEKDHNTQPKKEIKESLINNLSDVESKPNEIPVTTNDFKVAKEPVHNINTPSVSQQTEVAIQDPMKELRSLYGKKNVSFNSIAIETSEKTKFKGEVCVKIKNRIKTAEGFGSDENEAKKAAAQAYLENKFVPNNKKKYRGVESIETPSLKKGFFNDENKQLNEKSENKEIKPPLLRFDVPEFATILDPNPKKSQVASKKHAVRTAPKPVLSQKEIILENSGNTIKEVKNLDEKKICVLEKSPALFRDSEKQKVVKEAQENYSEISAIASENLSIVNETESLSDKPSNLIENTKSFINKDDGKLILNKEPSIEVNANSNLTEDTISADGKEGVKSIGWERFFKFATHSEIPMLFAKSKVELCQKSIEKLLMNNTYSYIEIPYEPMIEASRHKEIPNEPTIRRVVAEVLNGYSKVFVIHEGGEMAMQKLEKLEKEVITLSQKKTNLENDLQKKLSESKISIKVDQISVKSDDLSLDSIEEEFSNESDFIIERKVLNIYINSPYSSHFGTQIPLDYIEIEFDRETDFIRICPSSKITSFVVNHVGGKETANKIAKAEKIKENYLREIKHLENQL